MSKRVSTYCSLFMLLVASTSNAQILIKRAATAYNKYAYVQAAELYQDYVEQEPIIKAKGVEDYKDTLNLKALKRAKLDLGNSLLKLNRYEEAVKWYEEGFAKDGLEVDVDKQYYYNYGSALHASGQYSRAKGSFETFRRYDENDHSADELIEGLSKIDELKSKESEYEIGELYANCSATDMSPTFYKNGILIASARGQEYPLQHQSAWDGEGFLDLYFVKDGDTNATFFSKEINTRFHEGGACFNKREDMVFFTRTNYTKLLPSKSSEGVVRIKLFTSRLVDGKWDEISEFPYNSDEYSIGEPSLSDDGKTIYFVSDMPGGFGGTDIYMCSMNEDGDWGEVANLGPRINTTGNERSPFIDPDGDLFFSTDGRGGLGGLDIYHADHAGGETQTDHNLSDVHMALLGYDFVDSHEDHFEHAVNLGAPINSSGDDFGFIIQPDRNKGYLASNRAGGDGGDDVYMFIKKGSGEKLKAVVSAQHKEERQAKRAQAAAFKKIEEEARLAKIDEKAARIASKTAKSNVVEDSKIKGENLILSGVVYSKSKADSMSIGTPVSNASVIIFSGNDILNETTTGDNGSFTVTLPIGKNYSLLIQHGDLFAEDNIYLTEKAGINLAPAVFTIFTK